MCFCFPKIFLQKLQLHLCNITVFAGLSWITSWESDSISSPVGGFCLFPGCCDGRLSDQPEDEMMMKKTTTELFIAATKRTNAIRNGSHLVKWYLLFFLNFVAECRHQKKTIRLVWIGSWNFIPLLENYCDRFGILTLLRLICPMQNLRDHFLFYVKCIIFKLWKSLKCF